MLANGGELVVFLLFGLAILIGSLIKSYREAKAREETGRRLHPEAKDRPVTPVAGPPAGQRPVSTLRKVRTFLEDLQKEAQRSQELGTKPLPSGAPRPVRRVVRRKPPVPAKAEKPPEPEAEPDEPREGLAERMAARDKKEGIAPALRGRDVEAEQRVEPLRAILESQRNDLGKAILLTEILSKPVAFRGSPIPRYRS
ncbi:MAG TPA: hypothetical protein VMZ92_12560 [Planctomycetota bacterium]|nr:hypothetical protein [Planctomycetota bacterium]